MLNRTKNKQTLFDRNLMLRRFSLPNKKNKKESAQNQRVACVAGGFL